MKYLLFLFLFLFLSNKSATISIIKAIFGNKPQENELKNNEKYESIIKEKAGLKGLKKIRLYDTERFYGFMTGFPRKPIMAISQKAYKEFDNDEMEWLLLHESAHYVLLHNIKLAFSQVLLLAVGLYFLSLSTNLSLIILFIIIFAVSFSITAVQIAKHHEHEANNFAVKKMENPEGMIRAAESLIKTYYKPEMYDTSIKRWYRKLFFVWEYEMYLKQIEFAKKEMESRR
jgi:Zn-dependent protease with chaperone function